MTSAGKTVMMNITTVSAIRNGMTPRIIVNVAGYSTDDYVQTSATIAQQSDVDAIELNVSCPNVKDGLTFGTDPTLLKAVAAMPKADEAAADAPKS